jgi:pyruvate/2-oxoacid:ferredoxin oxidoreductase alpha subunit
MAKTLMKGNEAIAEAAIRAGCRFFFGYPITPQTEVPEYMSARMPEIAVAICRLRVKLQPSIWYLVQLVPAPV